MNELYQEKTTGISSISSNKEYYGLEYVTLMYDEEQEVYIVREHDVAELTYLKRKDSVIYFNVLYTLYNNDDFGIGDDTAHDEHTFTTLEEAESFYSKFNSLDWKVEAKKWLEDSKEMLISDHGNIEDEGYKEDLQDIMNQYEIIQRGIK